MTSPPKRRTVTVCDACRTESCWKGEFYCVDYKTAGTVEIPAPAQASGETKPLSHLWIEGHLSKAHQDGKHAKPAQGCPDCQPTAEPDAVERDRAFNGQFPLGSFESTQDLQRCLRFFRAGAKWGHAAGRAEALKPLREIYARGRVTFRSEGYLDSVDTQDEEFRRALDESGEGEK